MDEAKQKNVLFRYKGQRYPFTLSKLVETPYSVTPRPMFGASILTGEADYSNMRPDEVVPLVIQNDWRRGFQDVDYDDSKKYAYSQNCDARFNGRVMLSPKKGTAVTISTVLATLSDGFEQGSSTTLYLWESTLGDFATATRSTTGKRTGTYCACLTTTSNGHDAKIHRTLASGATALASYIGTTVTMTAYLDYDAAGATGSVTKLYISDGIGTTYSSDFTGSSYAQATVSREIAAGATELTIGIWLDTATDDTKTVYADDVTLATMIPAAPSLIIPFGSYLVAAVGAHLLYSSDGASFTQAIVFNDTITDLCVYGNNLWVMLGASAVPYYTSDLSTFTLSSQYGGDADRYTTLTAAIASSDTTPNVADRSVFSGDACYAVIDEDEDTEEIVQIDDVDEPDPAGITIDRAELGTTAYAHASGATIREIGAMSGAVYMANCGDRICAIADTTGTVRTSDDPTNNGTPLSTSITPPNSTYTITDMVDDPNGNTLMMKQDGPYIVVDDTASPSIPDTLSDVNTTDSYKGYVWKGYWYVPGGVNKLRRQNLSTDTVEDISITQYAQGDKDMDGKVTAIAGDGEYLYLAIDNGTYTEIIAGRDENVDGSTSWVWHPIWHVTPDDFVSMCVSAVSGSKKLYALTNTYTDGVQVFALSQSYSDPLIEASYEVTTSGTFVTPWYSTDFVENDKFWDSVWIGAINFQGYTSLRVSYQLEGQGEWDDTNDWTELGYCTASDMFSGTGATLVYPPEQVTRFSIGQTSRKIRFKFDLKAALDGSTTDEYSPVLTRIRVDGRVESSLAGVSLRKKNIACVLDLSGGPQSSVKGQLTALAALEAATEPIDFEGPDCIPRKVRFAQEGLETRLTRRPAEAKEAEFVAMLSLEEV